MEFFNNSPIIEIDYDSSNIKYNLLDMYERFKDLFIRVNPNTLPYLKENDFEGLENALNGLINNIELYGYERRTKI